MIRRALVFSTIAGMAVFADPVSARADEIDACANAYETAQRHHKAGELRASIVDAQTCARDVCPEILKKDCSSWVTAWRAEEREKEQRERAAKEPPSEPKTKPAPPPAASASTSTSTSTSTPAADEISRPVPTLTYVLGGVGLVALGGATAFMLNGISIRHELDKNQCAPSCDSDEVDRAKTSFLVADIFGAAGLVAIGGALVLYVTRPEVGGTRSASVSIIPSLGGASLRATF